MGSIQVINKDDPFVDGKLVFNFKSGPTAVAQSINTRLSTFLTEFYLNTKYGVDWYGTIFAHGVQPVEQQAALSDVASATNGVQILESSALVKYPLKRKSYFTARVISDGQIVDTNLPFDFLESE